MTVLHHVALGARDVALVASFYRDVLRLAQVREHFYEDGALRSVWLSTGSGVLMVEHTAAARDRVDGVGAGAFLIAVGWPDGIEHASAWLAERNVVVEARSEFSLYFRDPEGNRAAVSVYPLPAEAAESSL